MVRGVNRHRVHSLAARVLVSCRDRLVTSVSMQTLRRKDWYSRKVSAWRLSNSIAADFRVEAQKEALAKHSLLEIMSTNQGSQLTGHEWMNALSDARVKISKWGRGRWIDDYNAKRPHSAHGILSPEHAHKTLPGEKKIAA